MRTIEGKLVSQDKKYAIVVSRFNSFITSKLLDGAVDLLTRHDVADSDITAVWVPGSFEIPMMAQKLAGLKKFDGIICLGALIRGNTPHFDYISSEVTKGIAQVALEFKIPVVFGVITADTLEQAIERAGTKSGNKGAEAAASCIEMVNLFSQNI